MFTRDTKTLNLNKEKKIYQKRPLALHKQELNKDLPSPFVRALGGVNLSPSVTPINQFNFIFFSLNTLQLLFFDFSLFSRSFFLLQKVSSSARKKKSSRDTQTTWIVTREYIEPIRERDAVRAPKMSHSFVYFG